VRRQIIPSRVPLLLALAAGLSTSCARFGFDLLPTPRDDPPTQAGHGGDAGSHPSSTLDASTSAPAAGDASTPDVSADAGIDPGGTGGTGGTGATRNDGGTDGGTEPVPARCVAFGPFNPPVLVSGLNETATIGPALSDDALTLLYGTSSPYDIFITTRPDRDSAFGPGTLLANINQSGTDATPFLADSGLTLLLASDRFTTPGFNDLVIATRASLSDAFSTPTPIANVNSPGVELSPQLSEDGLRLYFSSDRSNSNRDIYLATRPARSATFSTPARVSGLNGPASDFGPALGTDELEAFIASDRPGGAGSMDLWRAVRATRSDAFGTPQNVTELNGAGYDTDPRLSADGSELFFSSSRNGDQVLWSARRPCVTFAP
jgi:WD40 repeat protein